jgi:pyruvate dehydrogenase E1 component beta subunit
MVLRTQGGTGRSAGAQHSQSLEAWILHTPGLRLAMPATAEDAYHLLRHSMSLPDPVVFIEHKALYTRKESVDFDKPVAPWGKAVVRREGADVTLVTYSRMVHYAMEAAQALAETGVQAAVIDLRTLNPLDMETVAAAVQRSGRAAVISEACLTGGVAAELAARISEECFDFLHEPVMRIAGEDIPISVSPLLESHSIPSPKSIARAVQRMFP